MQEHDGVAAARGRKAIPGDATVQRVADLFKALGDPGRVRILAALTQGPLCVHDLSESVSMSQSAVSHQLRLLRDRRLVAVERQGRHKIYRLDDKHIVDLFQRGLDHADHD